MLTLNALRHFFFIRCKVLTLFCLVTSLIISSCSGEKTGSDSEGDTGEDSTIDGSDISDLPSEEIELPDDIQIRLVDMQQRGSNIILFVAVTSLPEGEPVMGLSEGHFEVLEDGSALSVESSLKITPRPADYVWRALILFDTSYSILSTGGLEQVVSSVQSFAHRTTDQNTQAHRVGVATFDGAPSLRAVTTPLEPDENVNFTAQGIKLDQDITAFLTPECDVHGDCDSLYGSERPECIEGLCVDRSTNLYGAVRGGIWEVEAAIARETRVGVPRGGSLLVFTDGSDRAGRVVYEDVLQDVAFSPAYIFTIGVAGEINEEALQAIGRDGTVVIDSIEETDAGLNQIWEKIQNIGNGIYLISYCTATRTGDHEIDVRLRDYDDNLIVNYSSLSDALCDPEAASRACIDLNCGAGEGNFYCGDCGSYEVCMDGECLNYCSSGPCCDLENNIPKEAGALCRHSAGDCDVEEECDGLSPECPVDTVLPSSTVCRESAGPCDKEENCTGFASGCPADSFMPGDTVCRASAGDCDAEETCTGSSAACPEDQMRPASYVCRAVEGECDIAETCTGTSVSCPADQLRPSSFVCRASEGDCDVAENCSGVLASCPTDQFRPSSHVCRTSAGACDVEDHCSGTSASCPTDQFRPSSYVCRTSAGACDVEDRCSGTSASCPADQFRPPTYGCRSSAGVCDIAENCSGSSATCPVDQFRPSSYICRTSEGGCDIAESCSGTSALCPGDQLRPSSYVCRPAAGGCDIEENCTGFSVVCPTDQLRSEGHVCRPSAGDCDLEENCTGTSPSCPSNSYKSSTVVCRASEGFCDIEERCNGGSAACPGDQFRPSYYECRASAGACDVAENCTGSSAECPEDLLQPSTHICRVALDDCDAVEYCTGSSELCPEDENEPPETLCNDLDPCTFPDTCDGSGSCIGSYNNILHDVTEITTGGRHTCALYLSGGAKCWGYNEQGPLGDGTIINRAAPVDVEGLSSGVSAISAGGYHTCALMTSGGVKCWGSNGYGQLGDGTTTNSTTPVDVSGLSSGVSAISAGYFHTCALTNSRIIKCWGSNEYGQLGDGTTTNRTTPVGVYAGYAISAGGHHTCAIMIHSVKCWGDNESGQLGDGTTTNSTTPVDVSGLSSDVSAISAGYFHTCALINTGGVKCWGYNGNGQLGDGTTNNRTTPAYVFGLVSGISAISAGGHTCAHTDSDGGKCWGGNSSGQLGDGTTIDRTTPVDVLGFSSDFSVIAGGVHTCAIMNSSGLKCWGNNEYGQIGDGTTTNRTTPVDVLCE